MRGNLVLGLWLGPCNGIFVGVDEMDSKRRKEEMD